MEKQINNHRKNIDRIDKQLIGLLEKRFKIVWKMKALKKKQKIKMEDKNREKEIKLKYRKSKLPKGFSDKFFDSLFREAKR
jgi:chorismate mutase / prephenate dehydrogenase